MPSTAQILFTVILEFEGVNSISQFSAASPEDALREWQKGLDNPVQYGLKPNRAEALARTLQAEWNEHLESERIRGRNESFLRTVSETRNVWCVWLSVNQKSALVNIIATRAQ